LNSISTSDLHSNCLSGQAPSFFAIYGRTGLYFNIASNFFVGSIPNVTFPSYFDMRFNLLDNNSSLCRVVDTDCFPQCQNVLLNISDTSLPSGVESSVWSYLDIKLLGVRKRIIQVETHLSSVPHISKSHGCPRTSLTDSCVASSWKSSDTNPLIGYTKVDANITYLQRQIANTLEYFVYTVVGEPCTTSIQVQSRFDRKIER
jgi:hypothetical protein